MSVFRLGSTLKATFDAWIVGLQNITFQENFNSYEWSGEIAAGVEKGITHRLKVIPTRFMLLSARGTNQIIEGDTRHTLTHFYVKNVATTSTFTGKILILP